MSKSIHFYWNNIIADIPYLRELALNNNPLQKVEGHAFEMVPQIVALDVSGNEKILSRFNYYSCNFRLSNKENLSSCISQYRATGATLPS